MTLTSPALTDAKQRRLEAIRRDLHVAFKECGPRFLTPNPTYGVRYFVIAAEDTILNKEMCTKGGIVHRSALKETLNEEELDELIIELRTEEYIIKKYEKGGNDIEGHWIKFQTTYYAGNSK